MATYRMQIGDGEWDVEAPEDATPQQMQQIAASLISQQNIDDTAEQARQQEAQPQAQLTPTTPSVDNAPTTTTTSDVPQLPSAGMLPTAVRAFGGISAPLVAGAMATGSGGTLTLPAVATGGAIASGSEALAQWLEKQSAEGRESYSPARIAMEAPLVFVPIGKARTLGAALKEGAKAGALTTAGISAADYYDTGNLPKIKDVGTTMFITTLLATLGSRLAGVVERDAGPEAASQIAKSDDLLGNPMEVPPDRMREIEEIEKAAKKAPSQTGPDDPLTMRGKATRRGNVKKRQAAGKVIKPTSEEFDFSSSRKGGKVHPYGENAEGPIPEEAIATNPTDKVREDIALEGVSTRDPKIAANSLIEHVQSDLGVPEASRVNVTPKQAYSDFENYLERLYGGNFQSPVGPLGEFGLRPTADVVRDLSSATGIPAYHHYAWLERAVEQKRQFEDLWTGHGTKEQWGVTRIFRGTSKKRRYQITEWLEAKDKSVIEQKYGWKAGDIERAQQLRGFYNKLFALFGVDGDKFLTEYAPHIRKIMSSGVDLGSEDPRVPKEVLPFFKHDRTGQLDFYEKDALKAAVRYLKAGTFEKFLGPKWEEMRSLYYKLAENKTNSQAVRRLGNEMLKVLETIKGPKTDAVFVGMESFFNNLARRLGFDGGVDTHVVIDNLLNIQNLAYLGGNIPSLTRDVFQPVLTAYPLLGPKYFAKGLKIASTKAGRQAAEAAGITRGMTTGLHDALALAKGPVSRIIQSVTKKGMYPRQLNESFGRSAVYHAMYEKGKDALAEVMKHDLSAPEQLRRFLDLSDIDRMHPQTQLEIAHQFLMGNHAEALDVAARSMVNTTMFDYTAMGRPKIMRNTAGKLGLTYGVWPTAYTEFMVNFGNYGAPWKILRDRGRLLISHGAIVGLFGGLGVLAGDTDAFNDAFRQTFWGPTVPSESGLLNLGRSALESAGGSPTAPQELKYKARGLIPGASAYRNYRDIVDEPNSFRKAGRLFGFVRGHQKKDGTWVLSSPRPIKPPESSESKLFRNLFGGK